MRKYASVLARLFFVSISCGVVSSCYKQVSTEEKENGDDGGYPGDVGGDGDTDIDADADADSDADADNEDAGTDTQSVLCCGEDQGGERERCEGKPDAAGESCEDILMIGRNNFGPENYAQYERQTSTADIQNSYEASCNGSNETNGADAWIAVFVFEGERLNIYPEMSTWTGGNRGFVYLLKPNADDLCGKYEVLECRRFTMLLQDYINYTVQETGWHIIVLDAVGATTFIGTLRINISNCTVPEDCSCWLESDDFGPDSGEDKTND